MTKNQNYKIVVYLVSSHDGVESDISKQSRFSLQGLFNCEIIQFPFLLRINLSTKNAQQYFGLDLVEDGSRKTFWAHKAKVWEILFETVHDFAKNGQCDPINNMFNGF